MTSPSDGRGARYGRIDDGLRINLDYLEEISAHAGGDTRQVMQYIIELLLCVLSSVYRGDPEAMASHVERIGAGVAHELRSGILETAKGDRH